MSSGTRRNQKQQRRHKRRQKLDRRPERGAVAGAQGAGPRSAHAEVCPTCGGAEARPPSRFEDLFAEELREPLDAAAGLADLEDPLDAELTGAACVTQLAGRDDALAGILRAALVRTLEARADRGSLALLRAIGPVAAGVDGMLAHAASAAADRLATAGVPEPRWYADQAAPVQVECARMRVGQGFRSLLVGTFRRAGREHVFAVVVDEQTGLAHQVYLTDHHWLAELPAQLRADERLQDLEVDARPVEPAEWRRYVEEALHARAVQDEDEPGGHYAGEVSSGPPYPVAVALLRARLAALPPARTKSSVELPAARTKVAGPAPVCQVKVRLRGAGPTIWRRLLVPAELSLAELSVVVQAAFDWRGDHLHVFETPYGSFGHPDGESEHRDEGQVTLEQVAGHPGAAIRYTYDFGDEWEHDIVVERLLDRDPAVQYPTCVDGRRAAPPDNCGGLWKYEEMVGAFEDPGHDDRYELLDDLEWLVGDLDTFDPAAFDPDLVNALLAALLRRAPR